MGSLEKYKYKIFDFDGTIVALSVDWNAVRNKLSKEFGKDFTRINAGLKTLKKEDLPKAFKIIETFELSAEYRPNDYIVGYIRNCDGVLAIFSDNISSTVNGILEKLGILEKFAVVVGKDNVSDFKPGAEGMEKILKALGVRDRCDAVFIGDSEKDRIASGNAGIDFMAVKSVVCGE